MMNRLKFHRLFTIAVVAASPILGDTFQGRVIDAGSGKPVAGAIVTVLGADGGMQESGYADADGNFRIASRNTSASRIRARRPGYLDAITTAGTTVISLPKAVDPDALSASLTASAHAASIRWDSPAHKKNFVSQCHYCHQIGNALTRAPKTDDIWETTIARMEGYGALITYGDARAFRSTLAAAFQGKPVAFHQKHELQEGIVSAKITEWPLGETDSFLHDAEIHPNGRIYAVDMSKDKIYELDRITGSIRSFDLPVGDLPLGGMFAGAFRPLGTFAARHGPHSIQHGPDGLLWTTNSLAAEIMSFDPVTHNFKLYPVPDAVYPHTLRFDAKGNIWFTVALSNKIGRFDPRTGTFTLISLPTHGFLRWMSDAFVPVILKVSGWFPQKNLQVSLSHHKPSGEGHRILNLPYGIDVHPRDGSIWYSKLYAGYIGRVDPDTLEVTEYESPVGGPRRMRFAPDGMLWVPSFEEGTLLKIDTATMKFKRYALPLLDPSEYETPYALGIHPKTGDIWITSNLSDRVFRFDPNHESFTMYPSPTRVTYMRDMLFASDGAVCTTNSNMPAYAIEGGHQKVVCIEP